MENAIEENNSSNVFLEALVKNKSYYLKENLIDKKIAPTLAVASNRDKIIDFIGKFIDDNSSKLLTSGPVYIFSFNEKETAFLYDLFGVTHKELIEMFDEMIKVAYQGESKFQTLRSAIHKLFIAAMISESLNKNYTDIIECCEYLSVFAEYPLVFRKYWKIGAEVKADVMEYTIEHLPNRFSIKKQKNLLGLLKYIAHSALDFHTEKLKTGVDHELIDFTVRIRNQLNSAFKNIANKYYDNYKKDATMHSQVDQMDDGKFVDNEGTMTDIAATSENLYNKFLINSVNLSIAGAVADAVNINKDNLVGYLNKIYANKKNKLNIFIENVVYLFKSDEKFSSNDVDSAEFINFGLALYRSLGTSKIEQHKLIKETLDYWMDDIIDIRQDYNREATIIYYRRGIFNYFIFMMKYYN
jgi:hypothetical protein